MHPPQLPSLTAALQEQCDMREASGTTRRLVTSHTDGVYVEQMGQRYLSFCSNDYLGIAPSLSHHYVDVRGASASRSITGNHPAYTRLETLLADMKGTEAALVFGSGYLANIGTIPALVGAGDLVLMDRLSHACMIDGVRLSGAAFLRYRHNDMAHLEQLLHTHRGKYRRCLLLTETVFSMDGDRAPLNDMHTLATTYDAWLMTDDAHGFGLPSPAANPAIIQMGTLSKAVGVYGGYVAGSRILIEHLVNTARSALFSTALPIATIEAAIIALHTIRAEPERGERVMKLARLVTDALKLPAAQSAIVPLIIGDNTATLDAQERLKQHGILVSAIRPPTVPVGSARLRISLTATHTEEQVQQLLTFF